MGKKKKESDRPEWDTKLLVTEEDVLAAFESYDEWNLKMDPVLKALRTKLEAGGVLSLDDQRTVARCVMSDIAKQSWRVLCIPIFRSVAIECAEHLFRANKFLPK